MDGFYFSRFLFSLEAVTSLQLPSYKGSAIRGGFGHAFKKAVCASRNGDCSSCLLAASCVYLHVFETPAPDDSVLLRKHNVAPHPFIFEPPLTPKYCFEPGEHLDIQLVLIGNSIDYLPYFIYAFEKFGKTGIGRKRGKFHVDRVIATSPEGLKDDISLIYDKTSKEYRPAKNTIHWSALLANPPPTQLTLSFSTPVRLKYKGKLVNKLDFHILFRNLLRRISLLSYYHCGYKLDDTHFRDLINKAKKINTIKNELQWKDWSRWSNRQKTKMKLGGLVGEITYEGDLLPFWPYIRLGEYVHVGKGSSFGLGKYEVKGQAL